MITNTRISDYFISIKLIERMKRVSVITINTGKIKENPYVHPQNNVGKTEKKTGGVGLQPTNRFSYNNNDNNNYYYYDMAPSTIICTDIPRTVLLLCVSAFRPTLSLNTILHSPPAHLLFFRKFLVWNNFPTVLH
jgi:hypothetical protein